MKMRREFRSEVDAPSPRGFACGHDARTHTNRATDEDTAQETPTMIGTSLKRAVLSGLITIFCTGLCFVVASASSTAEEVGQLLTSLERSPCMFNRNGKWFSAA